MNQARYSILFSSSTGNTKLLAETIREVLPAEYCDYFGACSANEPESNTVYVGFWTNKGIADDNALQLLKVLRNKKIFLFGTAGFGGSEAYFKGILDKTKKAIDASNTVVGEYMCQGKMPQSVRERYVKMKEQPNHIPNIDAMIENFDKALSHPDEDDLNALKELVANTAQQ